VSETLLGLLMGIGDICCYVRMFKPHFCCVGAELHKMGGV